MSGNGYELSEAARSKRERRVLRASVSRGIVITHGQLENSHAGADMNFSNRVHFNLTQKEKEGNVFFLHDRFKQAKIRENDRGGWKTRLQLFTLTTDPVRSVRDFPATPGYRTSQYARSPAAFAVRQANNSAQTERLHIPKRQQAPGDSAHADPFPLDCL